MSISNFEFDEISQFQLAKRISQYFKDYSIHLNYLNNLNLKPINTM